MRDEWNLLMERFGRFAVQIWSKVLLMSSAIILPTSGLQWICLCRRCTGHWRQKIQGDGCLHYLGVKSAMERELLWFGNNWCMLLNAISQLGVRLKIDKYKSRFLWMCIKCSRRDIVWVSVLVCLDKAGYIFTLCISVNRKLNHLRWKEVWERID